MGYPEIILLAIYALEALSVLHYHNVARKANFWANAASGVALVGCLIAGGFFTSWGIPQSIYAFLFVLGYGAGWLTRGEDKKVSFYAYAPAQALMLGLFTWGGFFA